VIFLTEYATATISVWKDRRPVDISVQVSIRTRSGAAHSRGATRYGKVTLKVPKREQYTICLDDYGKTMGGYTTGDYDNIDFYI
jgi:hypothetical protein